MSTFNLSERANAFSIGALLSNRLKRKTNDDTDYVRHSKKLRNDSPISAVNCVLETADLWKKFESFGTEMIITKSGRRMFPTLRISFTNLERLAEYCVIVDIQPTDNKRYRYAYHRSTWLIAGKADSTPTSRIIIHQDSPFTGQQLENQVLSFEKVKLTNNDLDKSGQLILNSMHKYQPRIHLVKIGHIADFQQKLRKRTIDHLITNLQSLDNFEHQTFSFPETTFIAVTAYQNQLITKLKIDCNPFAKGFRDASRLIDFDKEFNYSSKSSNSNEKNDKSEKMISVDDVLNPQQKKLNAYLLHQAKQIFERNRMEILKNKPETKTNTEITLFHSLLHQMKPSFSINDFLNFMNLQQSTLSTSSPTITSMQHTPSMKKIVESIERSSLSSTSTYMLLNLLLMKCHRNDEK
ncbi:hypothetical protein SNEBB_004894 [Seison nebaliae]|nr:hypothetical protein SNEBB_004894 [Seison nebaliae]